VTDDEGSGLGDAPEAPASPYGPPVPAEPARPGRGERDAFGNPIAPGTDSAPGAVPAPAPPPPPSPVPPGYPPPAGAPAPGAPPLGAPTHPPPTHPPPTGGAYPPPHQIPVHGPRPRGPNNEPMYGRYELASWGQRVAARLLDLLFGYTPIVVGIGFAASGVSSLEVIGGILIALWFFYYLMYAPLFMARGGERNGQTPGKQIMGIRVIRESGESISVGFGMLREIVIRGLLFGVVGGFFFFPPILDYLWPLWDDENRCLHDMVASTRVARADPVG
jgi:uncharacterized RDD family membrane protein YckC